MAVDQNSLTIYVSEEEKIIIIITWTYIVKVIYANASDCICDTKCVFFLEFFFLWIGCCMCFFFLSRWQIQFKTNKKLLQTIFFFLKKKSKTMIRCVSDFFSAFFFVNLFVYRWRWHDMMAFIRMRFEYAIIVFFSLLLWMGWGTAAAAVATAEKKQQHKLRRKK